MAYDEGLAWRIRQHFEDEPGITDKKMFGGLCFLHRGNMVAGWLELGLRHASSLPPKAPKAAVPGKSAAKKKKAPAKRAGRKSGPAGRGSGR